MSDSARVLDVSEELKEVLAGVRELLAENVPLSPDMTKKLLQAMSTYLAAMDVGLNRLEKAV